METNHKKEFMTAHEYHKIFRGRIEYANNMINQRLTWMSISQSFFYSAYAIIINAPEKAKNALFEQMVLILQWVLPVAALCACIFSYIGVIVTVFDLPLIAKSFKKYYQNAEVDQALPPIHGNKLVSIMEQVSPVVLPLIFISTWIILLYYQLKYY